MLIYLDLDIPGDQPGSVRVTIAILTLLPPGGLGVGGQVPGQLGPPVQGAPGDTCRYV